jgi:hypothetical protein
VKRRAAFAGKRVGGCGEEGRELAGGESIQRVEASRELSGTQTALAVQLAQETCQAMLAQPEEKQKAGGVGSSPNLTKED